ncbi:MAG: cell division protein FtsB [Pseudohongiellaceae bacterium]
MKTLLKILAVILIVLQYQLWFGDGGLRSLGILEQDIATQREQNTELTQRNEVLEIDVLDLKNGLEAVEERARSELGMIDKDETFYLIVETPQ